MGTAASAMPAALRGLDRWVCADSGTKRPMRPFDGGPASVTDPATWGSYEDARRCVEEGVYEWMGFVFADDGLVGIDIDHAFDADGLCSDEALEAVVRCASYTEVSRSGEGLHIVCRASLPFAGRNNRHGWEAYRDRRFFVLTGRTVGPYTEVADAQDGVDAVVRDHFAEPEARAGGGPRGAAIWAPESGGELRGRRLALPSYPPATSGSRHISMVSYCGQVWSSGASREGVLRAALAANGRWVDPPLDEAEVRQVAASVTRYRR